MTSTGHATQRAQRQAALKDRIELIEDYLASGIEPARIAADIGIDPASLERSMRRNGRHDLANRLHVPRRRNPRSKRLQCPDCHAPITDRATTCMSCWRRRESQGKWAA